MCTWVTKEESNTFIRAFGTTRPITQCHIPQDLNTQHHCCQNLIWEIWDRQQCCYIECDSIAHVVQVKSYDSTPMIQSKWIQYHICPSLNQNLYYHPVPEYRRPNTVILINTHTHFSLPTHTLINPRVVAPYWPPQLVAWGLVDPIIINFFLNLNYFWKIFAKWFHVWDTR